jgi:hypothetical protein
VEKQARRNAVVHVRWGGGLLGGWPMAVGGDGTGDSQIVCVFSDFHFRIFISGFRKNDRVIVNSFFSGDKFFHYGVRGRFCDMLHWIFIFSSI